MSHVLAARRSTTPFPVRVRAGLGAPLGAETIDLRAIAGPVDDQSATNRCAGETIAAACFTAAGGKGAYPSSRAAYDLGRMIERERIGARLQDDGAALSDVMGGVVAVDGKLRGLVSEARFPSDGPINDELPLDVLEDLEPILPGDAHQLVSMGDQLAADIDTTLAQGRAVGFGMHVDMLYEYWTTGIYAGLRGPSLGNHAQLIVGRTPAAFLVKGSWGTGFGVGGYVLISRAFIASPDCWDFVVVERAPVLA